MEKGQNVKHADYDGGNEGMMSSDESEDGG